MTPSLLAEIRLILILAGICFLPGSALLAASGAGRHWTGLQRPIVAIGLSLACYPVFFYAVRFLLPAASVGPYILAFLLLLAAFVAGLEWWKRRADVAEQTLPAASAQKETAVAYFTRRAGHHRANSAPGAFRLDRLEWVALAIIGLTFASRLWFAHAHPFPAWSDSLHHTLLTRLTAEHGRLPATLEPYFPNSLAMYHLGLYALSGTAQILAQVPAHSALLWTAQFLNGLCGLGVYLALDRYVGRAGAVTGLAVVGLFSAHPALWANWGRFTQLSSQTILLIAWVITLEAVVPLRQKREGEEGNHTQRWMILFAAMTTAAVFLFHFRVAIFYFLLLLPTLAIVLWQAPSSRDRRVIIRNSTAAGTLALLIILPVLWDAAGVYFSRQLAPATVATPAQQEEFIRDYYRFPLSTLPHLAAPIWMLVTGAAAALLGLIRRNALALTALLWVLLLLLLGNTYRLGVPVLNVTNLGAILIMLYLPIGLLFGIGVTEGMRFIPQPHRRRARAVFIALLFVAALPATHARATTVEPHRHFMTASDRAAMSWIEENVPQNALFAINVYFWLPDFAHGTDAGYWIPYWTGREIVTSAMLTDGLPSDYRKRVFARSEAAEALENDLAALEELHKLGVEYIYIGVQGDFSGVGLRSDFLTQSGRVELLYERDGAAVLRIHPENQTFQEEGHRMIQRGSPISLRRVDRDGPGAPPQSPERP